MNHAIHMVAVTQLRFPNTEGRAYFERKLAEGKTGKEALRSLKRRISDALYARLLEDARRDDAARESGSGRAHGERLCIQRGRLTPRDTDSSEKPLPDHQQAYDRPGGPAPDRSRHDRKDLPPRLLTNKEDSFGTASDFARPPAHVRSDQAVCTHGANPMRGQHDRGRHRESMTRPLRWAFHRDWLWWVFVALSVVGLVRMLASPIHHRSHSTTAGVSSDPRLILQFGSWQLYAHGFWLDLLGSLAIVVFAGLFTWLVLGGLRAIVRGLAGVAHRLPGWLRRLNEQYRAKRPERGRFRRQRRHQHFGSHGLSHSPADYAAHASDP